MRGLAGIGPTLDARTLETLGPGGRNRYGQVRAFGSLAFVIIDPAGRLAARRRGARTLFWVYLPCLLGTVVVTATIRRRGSTTRSVSLLRGAGSILGAPGSLVFFGGFTIVWTALAATNAFYSIQVVALGGGNALVGIAWAFGAIIEVPLMYAFPRLGARFGTERLLVFGALVFTLRGFLAAMAFDPLMLVLIAPLEGIAFACVFVGGVTVLAARVRPSLGGTAQGLFSASAGLATIIGSVVRGTIAGAVGIPGMFAACAMDRPARCSAMRCSSRPPRAGSPPGPRAGGRPDLGRRVHATPIKRSTASSRHLQDAVDEQVLPHERLDLGDLAGVGRVGLDQQVVELGGDLVGVLRDERGEQVGRRMASRTRRRAVAAGQDEAERAVPFPAVPTCAPTIAWITSVAVARAR